MESPVIQRTAAAELLRIELGKELAARGHKVHFISYALPTRLTELNENIQFHEVEMLAYPLFEHQPYSLALATKMSRSPKAKSSTCCTYIMQFRILSAVFWRRDAETQTVSSRRDDAARH